MNNYKEKLNIIKSNMKYTAYISWALLAMWSIAGIYFAIGIIFGKIYSVIFLVISLIKVVAYIREIKNINNTRDKAEHTMRLYAHVFEFGDQKDIDRIELLMVQHTNRVKNGQNFMVSWDRMNDELKDLCDAISAY